MALKEIFEKQIDRTIDGVIKADDYENLKQEIEEYVITKEIEKHLGNFFDAYNNYQKANGVWISGFFGSGKSHLLKMLSLVLENDSVDGSKATSIFLDKPLFKDNTFLRKDVEKASSIPSKSILFNIDAKSDASPTEQSDAILSVFVKVFDEFCGYCGQLAYVANFERVLDEADLLDSFKDQIKDLTKEDWSFVRDRRSLFSKQIDSAYNKVTNQSLENILGSFSKDYSLSIEDFANRVKDYINKQDDNFRLNFFVDEVGQYIAGNTSLMLNLQSIAESLATKCKGRSWIMVTSQEEMRDLVGEMDTQQGSDFSRVQARFANRMSLTSQDVAEVIQKRLLLKNAEATKDLAIIYNNQKNNFKTLFTFLDGAQTYRNFKDKEHFTYCYPFIPYQFSLFQETMKGLSNHDAFHGRHQAVGERSMIDVFQNVANQVSDYELGELATFDLMFEGIRKILKSQIQTRILLAENELPDDFAIKILKALFLVKYVKGIKTTLKNICVLMINSFDQDINTLKSNVEEALNLLEQQTYIKRKDNQYEYLSDEEKDIEEEIKSTIVESSDLSEELNQIIFDRILRDPKIKYQKNNQDYKFNRKIDGTLFSRDTEELSINIVTPLNLDAGNNDPFLMKSMTLDELFIVMPTNANLVNNLNLYKQTHKYLKQYDTTQADLLTNQILSERGLQNERLMGELINQIGELIGQSDIILNGEKLENITSQDAKSKIIAGFNALINNVYPNLEMIPVDNVFTEATLIQYIDSTQGEISTDLSPPELEIFSFVQLNIDKAYRLTYKTLLDHFEKKPYGWSRIAIHCLTAKLFSHAKIELSKDSSNLKGKDLMNALQTNNLWANIVIKLQADFSPKELRDLKKFYVDYFNQPAVSSDARNLANETSDSFDAFIDNLSDLSTKSNDFPFLDQLNQSIEELKPKQDKEYSWYIKELPAFHKDLLKTKLDIIDPIQTFIQGSQKQIYLDAKTFINENNSNSHHFKGDEFQSIIDGLDDPNCHKGDVIRTIKANLKKCNDEIALIIKSNRDLEIKNVESHKARFEEEDGYKKLTSEQKESVNNAYEELKQDINGVNLIDSIPGKLTTFENSKYKTLLDMLSPVEPNQPQNPSEYVSLDSIKPKFKALITTEEDIDSYFEILKKECLKELKTGKKIQL